MTDRNLNIRVALSAANKLSGPVSAAQRSAAGLASQIKATQGSIKNLDSQAKTFDRLNASINKNAAAYEAAKAKAKSLRAEFGPLKQQTDEQRKALAASRLERDRLGRSLDKEKQKLNAVTAQMYRHGVSVRQSDSATAQITRRTENYNRQLAVQQRRLSAVTRMQANVARAKETRGKLTEAGAKGIVTGGVMLAPVVAAAKSYSGMEDAMKGVAKQVNALRDDNGKRTAQYYEMQSAIKAASEQLPLENGAQDYAALIAGGARMGAVNQDDPWKKQKADLLAFATVAAMAAKAFELPADQLSEDLGKIAGLYKIPIQNVEALGDVINYLDDNAQSKGADIINVITRVGGLADKLSYQQAAALGSTMLTLGSVPEQAASAVNAMVREMSNATQGSDRFMSAMDELGLSADKVQKRMTVDALGTITTILEAIKKLPAYKQSSIVTNLFGKDFGKDVTKLANNLPELYRQLDLVSSKASRGSMRRESDIDKDSLSAQALLAKSAIANDISSAGEQLRAPLLDILLKTQEIAKSFRAWIEANPELAGTLLKVAAGAGIIVGVLGALALAAAGLIVPFALMRLSVFMLTGGRGLRALIPSAKGLTGALGRLTPSLSGVGRSIKDWPGVFRGGLTALGNLRSRVALLGSNALMGLSRGAATAGRGLFMAFTQPGAALAVLGNGLRTLAMSGFGSLFNIARTGLTMLGGGFSLLLSPVGLLAMAIIGAGLLIWKFWEPIKAFFSGFFTGLVEGLAPIKLAFEAAFAPLAPIFDGISSAIGKVWNWFKSLLEPVETSKESLEKCTAAGETFGKVVGMAISGLMWPIAQIAKGLGWILEKLGVIPSAAEAAKQAIAAMSPDDAKKLAGKANLLLQDVNAITQAGKKTKEAEEAKQGAIKKTGETAEQVYGGSPPPPTKTNYEDLAGSSSGKKGKKSKAAGAAASTAAGTPAAEVKKLGDIIFKNRPPVTAIDGAYQEPRLQVQRESLLARLKRSAVSLADSVLPPTIQPALAGIPIPETPARSFNGNRQAVSRDNYTFEVHFHGVDMSDRRALGELVKDKLRELMRENDTRRRSRLSDKE
uniref:Chromosome partition protein Smc n=1 Tax=Serratia marcescens TaxID=615 RepID=A0A1C3HKN6_SERMA|nr:Chromosome partition protein Smc [Serratia marcescens]